MAKQKSIGYTIFAICGALYARTAFLAPTPEELQNEVVAEDYHDFGADRDSLGVLHGLRHYILGVGVVGLLIALEDDFTKKKKKKPVGAAEAASPAPPPSGPPESS